ncbi:GH25 family lysozyme [Furfurilactobacillus curtus]
MAEPQSVLSRLNRRQHKRRRPKWWAWLAIVIAIVGIMTAGFGGVHWWHLRHQIVLKKYPVTGVAIDQDAGFIDFQALSKTGLQFIYLKTTVGNRYTDDDFADNYQRSIGSSLKIGVYLTYSPNSTIMSQVRYFHQQVGHSTGTLPIMIVVPEGIGDLSDSAVLKKTTQRLTTMQVQLQQQTDQPVGLWIAPQQATKLDKSRTWRMLTLTDEPLKQHYQSNIDFISYDDSGSIIVDGSRQSLNLMVYNGSKKMFETLATEN